MIRKIPRPLLPVRLPCGCRVKKTAPRSKLEVQVTRQAENVLWCACGRRWVAIVGIHEIPLSGGAAGG